jgi:hypothetical protein
MAECNRFIAGGLDLKWLSWLDLAAISGFRGSIRLILHGFGLLSFIPLLGRAFGVWRSGKSLF